jgi:hypothetical protein
MKLAIFSTSDNKYAPCVLVALKIFLKRNVDFDAFVFGTKFTPEMHELFQVHHITLVEVDLSKEYFREWKYPRECYYWSYGPDYLYKLGYTHSIYIDGDIYSNKAIYMEDLLSIDYIGGVKMDKIKDVIPEVDFHPIMEQFGVKPKDFNNHRIQTGVLFMNNKALTDDKFHDKMVNLYTESIKIDAPRKGDDSLFGLYQLHYQNNVYTPLDSNYNTIPWVVRKNDNFDYNDIIFLHFSGKAKKPWNFFNESVRDYPLDYLNYFNWKWRDFVLDNFSDDFIKVHFKQLYREKLIDMEDLFFYWFPEANVGDYVTPYLVKKFIGHRPEHRDPVRVRDKVVLSTGSIMRLSAKNAIIYGSGIRNYDQDIKPGWNKFVRGPLTRQRILEVHGKCPPIYGDPALLLKDYYQPEITEKKYKLGITPHYTEFTQVKKLYENVPEVLVINNGTNDVEEVIDQIVLCERVVSSSLHGIVFANTYGIPVRWVKYSSNIIGDDTKFHDHFASIGRPKERYINLYLFKYVNYQELCDQVSGYTVNINLDLLRDTFFLTPEGLKKSFLNMMTVLNEKETL